MSELDTMDVAELRKMHPALRSRCLESFLKANGIREPEASHIAQAESLVFSANPSAFSKFPGGITITRNYGVLEVRQEQEKLPAMVLPVCGTVQLRLGSKINMLEKTVLICCLSLLP
jgi:hypothetical protein